METFKNNTVVCQEAEKGCMTAKCTSLLDVMNGKTLRYVAQLKSLMPSRPVRSYTEGTVRQFSRHMDLTLYA